MKKSFAFLILSFLVTVSVYSQITVTRTDYPSRGDVFFILNDNNMSGLNAGGTGMQNWDFTSLDVSNLDTIVFVEPTTSAPYSTPFDTFFTNSNLALSGAIGGVYLNISNDSLMLDGIATELLGSGVVTPVNIKPDLKLIEFPANYQDGYTSVGIVDTSIDTLILGGVIDSVRAVQTITNTVSLDAYGNIDLPNGSYQTLRMFTKRKSVTEIYLHNSFTGYPPNPNQVINDSNFTYNWIAKNQGYYVMEATADNNGNLISGFFKSSPQVFAFTAQKTAPSCPGDCDGSINVTGVGGTGSYSFAWSANAGGSTSGSLSGLCAGDYIYTITDNVNSTSHTDTVSIVDPTAISIVASLIKESPLGDDGEIRLTVSGGTPPYSYAWTGTNQQTKDVNSLSGGSYTVTITDSKTCSLDTTFTLGTRVGLSEVTNGKGFSIYPNPASTEVQIVTDLSVESIRIIDVLGKTVYKGSELTVPVKEFENGLYILELRSIEGKVATSRLVVRH